MNWFNTILKPDCAHVWIFNEVGVGQSAEEFITSLGDAQNVELFIDSPGGDSGTAVKVHGELSKRNTSATITGACGSSSLIVAMAAKKISCNIISRLLVHSPASFVCGTASELRLEAEQLQKLQSTWRDIICTRTKQDATTVERWLSTDTYFDAEQAEAVGLVDELYTPAPITIAPQSSSCANIVADAPKPMPESEAAFRYWLDIFGKVETHDRAALMKTLQEFCDFKIVEQ